MDLDPLSRIFWAKEANLAAVGEECVCDSDDAVVLAEFIPWTVEDVLNPTVFPCPLST